MLPSLARELILRFVPAVTLPVVSMLPEDMRLKLEPAEELARVNVAALALTIFTLPVAEVLTCRFDVLRLRAVLAVAKPMEPVPLASVTVFAVRTLLPNCMAPTPPTMSVMLLVETVPAD